MAKQKKILILGGGQAQIELIKAALELGCYTIVAGIEGNYLGYALANKVCHVDIFNKEAILKIAQDEEVDGVSKVCSDFGLQSLGYVNDKLSLSGMSESSAIVSSDKYKMKLALTKAGVNTPKFAIVETDEDVERALSMMSFPLIVKAVDLQGSRGIYICRSESEIYENYKKSISESRHNYCIIEEFIEGEEFGAQAFVYEQDVLFVLPHGDNVKKNGIVNIPIGHYMPLPSDMVSNEAVVSLVKNAIKALGFNNTAVNVDLIVKDGTPYIIELTGRAGANYLPEMTGAYWGIDYYKMILLCAMGESPRKYFDGRLGGYDAIATRMLYSKESGVVKNISYNNSSNIRNIELFVKKGDVVNKFSNSRDCVGRILCVGKTVSECATNIDEFVDNFKIELE